jgi:uncharacterized membrane protein YfcA
MDSIFLLGLTFFVALIYASIGHGGASGYLALLSFFSIPHEEMATSALCLNLLVSAAAFWSFSKAAYFSWRLTWPFVVSSIPAAFLGGLLKVSAQTYSFLLVGILLFAAFRLLIDPVPKSEAALLRIPSLKATLPLGAGVGALSGMVGIGGGIFLSPLMLLFHWAGAKAVAATSAFFIFVNSLAGLLGRAMRENFSVNPSPLLWGMVATAFVGGILGSRLGANHFSSQWLRRTLGAVLLVAVFKLFRTWGLAIGGD